MTETDPAAENEKRRRRIARRRIAEKKTWTWTQTSLQDSLWRIAWM